MNYESEDDQLLSEDSEVEFDYVEQSQDILGSVFLINRALAFRSWVSSVIGQ
jgi:hypothetical protein